MKSLSVLVPMPIITASQIVSVQPMDINRLWKPYNYIRPIELTKDHYRHFSRIYNRRKYHSISYLNSLNYSRVDISQTDIENIHHAKKWVKQNLKRGSYINLSGTFWFAYDKDFTFFCLKWC